MARGITDIPLYTGSIYVPPNTGGAPGIFAANDYTGCKLWCAADLEFYSDNDPATDWVDYSTLNNHFTTATNPPTYKIDIINGKPVYRFDGTNDKMANSNLSSLITNGAHCIFMVLKVKAFNTNNATPNLNECIFSDGTDGNISCYVKSNSGSPIVGFDSNDGVSDSIAISLTADAPYLIQIRHEGGFIYIKKNDEAETSTASADTTATNQLLLGCNFDSTEFTQMDIAEIIIYDNALSAMDRLAISNEMNTKYALY